MALHSHSPLSLPPSLPRVSNYWKSFIAAMAGSVACNLFLITEAGAQSDPLLVLQVGPTHMYM